MCNFAASIAAAVAVAITAIGASDTAHALAVRLHGIDPIFSIDPGAPGPFIPLQSLDIADNGGRDLDPGQGRIGFSGDFVGYSFDLLAIST